MKLVATFHGPTSVSHSIICNLTNDEDIEYLIVARTSVLEAYAILPESLSLQCTFEVWGRISSLKALTYEDDSRQYILVTTDHPDPRLLTLALDLGDGSCSLKCISSLSLHERGARPAEFYNDCLVDQRNNVAVISTYVGKLKVVECNNGKFECDFDSSIRELNILSMCFIQSNSTRTSALAVLHQDHTRKLVLTSHELSVSDRDLSSATSSMLANVVVPETDSNLIISVPPHGRNSWNSNGGILVLGGSRVLFYSIDRKQKRKSGDKSAQRDKEDRKSATAEVAWEYAEITAWCKIDPEGTRYLLGDSFGRLLLLAFDQASPKIHLLLLGEISSPTSLTLLSSQYIFVGSHFGDSQLVRIIPDKSSITGSFIDIVDTFRNIAPIMDAVVVDPDGSGESRIVTCSGGKNTGSLRMIQNGANFDVNATLDGIPNITNLFSLKTEFAADYHTYLLATTAASTHLLRFSSDRDARSTITRVTDFHMQNGAPTLACANIMTRRKREGRSVYESGPFAVQVTPEVVLLLNMSLGTTESQWSPVNTHKIVLADISPSQICLALSNGEVVILTVLENAFVEYTRKTMFGPGGETLEASALAFVPPNAGKYASDCIITGFWETREVKAYTLPALELKKEFSASFPCFPNSVVLHDFGDDVARPLMHLLVGLADGSLHSFSVTEEGLGERKVVSLGDLPISLVRCRVDGLSTVLATGTRASLFFWQKDTLHHSPVLVKDVSASAALHTRGFGESLVLASQNRLVIGRILELDKLHIRTVPLGPNVPVKISYHPLAKSFGVGCLKTEISDPLKLGKISSSFKVFDAAALSQIELYEYDLKDAEEVASLCTARLDLRGNEKSYFAVGTMFYEDMESEPSRGRVLLFNVDGLETRSVLPHLAAQTEIKGCAYALMSQNGKLVAAVNTGVVLFGLQDSPEGYNTVELVERDAWNHNYLVTNLVIRENYIIIGDAVNSVAILEIINDRIVLKARDFSPLWPLSLEASDKTSIIGANSDDNLFTLKLVSREDKYVLERDGNFFIGETVNKFVPGSLGSSAGNTTVQPQQLYFTSTGRISVVLDVDEALSLKLSALQRNIAGCIKGPGNIDHAAWRAPKNSRGRSDAQLTSFGFLDGDFLERFLNYSSSSPTASQILAGSNDAERLNMSYMDVRTILESIRSMH